MSSKSPAECALITARDPFEKGAEQGFLVRHFFMNTLTHRDMEPAKLPPLDCVSGALVRPAEIGMQQEWLFQVLRTAAKRLRRQKSRPFYSVREVSRLCELSVGAVAACYERLEREGLINRMRGSGTILVGRVLTPRIPARAVVGILTNRYAMVANPDTRALDLELMECLSRRGYLADLIFYPGNFDEPDLVPYLLRRRLDVYILDKSGPGSRQNILSLRDRGIRAMALQDMDDPATLNAVTYGLDWSSAYRTLAKRWAECGIRRVMAPMKSELVHRAKPKGFEAIFEEAGIRVDFCNYDFGLLLKAVRRTGTGVAFLDRYRAGRICNRHPLEAERLMRRARVAFCRGPIYGPYLNFCGAKADLVVFSPTPVATEIAADVGRLSELSDGLRHIFQAELHEQVAFEDPAADQYTFH